MPERQCDVLLYYSPEYSAKAQNGAAKIVEDKENEQSSEIFCDICEIIKS